MTSWRVVCCLSLCLLGTCSRPINSANIPLWKYNKHNMGNDYASESHIVTRSYSEAAGNIEPEVYNSGAGDIIKNRPYRDNYEVPPKEYKEYRNEYYLDEPDLPEKVTNLPHSEASKSVDGLSARERVIRQIGDQLSVEYGNDHQSPQWEKKRKVGVPQPKRGEGGGGVVKSRDVYDDYYNDDDDYYVPPGSARQRKGMMSVPAVPRYTEIVAIETTTDEDEEWNRWFILARTSSSTINNYSLFKCLLWTTLYMQLNIFKMGI